MFKVKEAPCNIGDYVEIVAGMLRGEPMLMRGIVLAVENEPRLWTSYCIYVFETHEKRWFYSYELTVISP